MTTSLMLERFAVGGGSMDYTEYFDDVLALVRGSDRAADPLVRQALGRCYRDVVILRLLALRLMTSIDAGEEPGPEGSILKLAAAEFNVRLHELAMDVLGPGALRADSVFAKRLLRSRGSTIEGGTSEIQRNILGERVLGLPREPKPVPRT
jgi:alkylation response protein AidB-like acyl-CoA dehydrogenase